MRKLLIAGAAVAGVLAVMAAGIYTSGFPVTGSLPPGGYGMLTPMSLLPLDTQLPQGANPATVGVTPIEVAALYYEILSNTAVVTTGAATLNAQTGNLTIASLTTAPGATFTLTLTDNLIVAGQIPPKVVLMGNTANPGGSNVNYPLWQHEPMMNLTSVSVVNGSVTWIWTNNGTTALSGTWAAFFHL